MIKTLDYLFEKYEGILKDELKIKLLKLEDMNLYEIQKQFPRFFYYDIKEFKKENSDKKFVIFMDTYELLCKGKPNDAEYLKQDERIRDFIKQNKNVLFVISGREKLRWEICDKNWGKILEQFRLEELSSDDCRYFLNHYGINDETLQSDIIEKSCGVPFYLNLICMLKFGKIMVVKMCLKI